MRSLVYYGPRDLRVEDRPDLPLGPKDVRVAVKASGICGSDLHAVARATPRRTPGIVMGHEVTGVVVEAGTDAIACRVGDRVAIQPLRSCGRCPLCLAGRSNACESRTLYGMTPGMPGGYAERIVVTEDRILPLPDGVPFDLGTLAEPLAVGLHAVGRGPAGYRERVPRAGERPSGPARSVAVVGSGTIGLMTLVALSTLAPETIFVIDKLESKLAYAKPLGARTILAGQDDPLAVVREATGGRGVDWAIEAVGVSETAALAVELARTGGHVTWIGNAQPLVEINMQSVVVGEKTVAGSYGYTDDDFRRTLGLVAEGRVPAGWLADRPVTLDTAPQDFIALATGEWPCIKAVLVP